MELDLKFLVRLGTSHGCNLADSFGERALGRVVQLGKTQRQSLRLVKFPAKPWKFSRTARLLSLQFWRYPPGLVAGEQVRGAGGHRRCLVDLADLLAA
jgi:hypothetical protein